MANHGCFFMDDGNYVQWRRGNSRDGREYFVFSRNGYPPLVLRHKPTPAELSKVYETDTVVRMENA